MAERQFKNRVIKANLRQREREREREEGGGKPKRCDSNVRSQAFVSVSSLVEYIIILGARDLSFISAEKQQKQPLKQQLGFGKFASVQQSLLLFSLA